MHENLQDELMNTSGDDIAQIRDVLGQGAQKLQDYIQRYGLQ